jgi:putative flavoprotein involved in K+ transport
MTRNTSDTRASGWVEEGAAFASLAGLPSAVPAQEGKEVAPRMSRPGLGNGPSPLPERFEVVVIGAGQAGLSVGYHLKRSGVRFVILDANSRVGDAWRNRWDSLRLFTPARFDSLDGMPFPAPARYFPTKDEMGDYLERYARNFDLPVRTGMRVTRLARHGGRYRVEAGASRFEADHVVIAMSNFQHKKEPAFAKDLAREIVQLHSSDYRNASQLAPGGVLITGGGNSGSEIAMEMARQGRAVWMSGRDTGHIPFRIEGMLGSRLMVPLVLRGIFHRVLTTDTPMGRRVRPGTLTQGGPLVRVKPQDLKAKGVVRVPRVRGVVGGKPVLEDGTVMDVPNVIWCTGYHPGFSWIELDVFDADGEPRHRRGVVEGETGLYFVGLEFLYAMSSTMIHGVGRDAAHVAARIAARRKGAAVVAA